MFELSAWIPSYKYQNLFNSNCMHSDNYLVYFSSANFSLIVAFLSLSSINFSRTLNSLSLPKHRYYTPFQNSYSFNPLSFFLFFFFILFNPSPAKLLKLNYPHSIIWTAHYHFQGYQDGNLKLVSQKYGAWSDCMDVQASLTLYWWHRLSTFGSSRIRVKATHDDICAFEIVLKKR